MLSLSSSRSYEIKSSMEEFRLMVHLRWALFLWCLFSTFGKNCGANLKITVKRNTSPKIQSIGLIYESPKRMTIQDFALNTSSVSGSSQCWSMVTLESRPPHPIPKRHPRPALAAAADARCGYTIRGLTFWMT